MSKVEPCRQGSQPPLPPEQSTELNLLTLSSCQPRNQPAPACRGFSSTERRRCRLQWKESIETGRAASEKVKLGGWSACRVTADVEKVAERKSRRCEPGNQVTFHLMFNPAQVTFLLLPSTTKLCLIQLRNAE